MKQHEIADAIGKKVTTNGFRDLGMDREMRRIIGQECLLIKQCKSGLLYVEHAGRFYSLPMSNVNILTQSDAIEPDGGQSNYPDPPNVKFVFAAPRFQMGLGVRAFAEKILENMKKE